MTVYSPDKEMQKQCSQASFEIQLEHRCLIKTALDVSFSKEYASTYTYRSQLKRHPINEEYDWWWRWLEKILSYQGSLKALIWEMNALKCSQSSQAFWTILESVVQCKIAPLTFLNSMKSTNVPLNCFTTRILFSFNTRSLNIHSFNRYLSCQVSNRRILADLQKSTQTQVFNQKRKSPSHKECTILQTHHVKQTLFLMNQVLNNVPLKGYANTYHVSTLVQEPDSLRWRFEGQFTRGFSTIKTLGWKQTAPFTWARFSY